LRGEGGVGATVGHEKRERGGKYISDILQKKKKEKKTWTGRNRNNLREKAIKLRNRGLFSHFLRDGKGGILEFPLRRSFKGGGKKVSAKERKEVK